MSALIIFYYLLISVLFLLNIYVLGFIISWYTYNMTNSDLFLKPIKNHVRLSINLIFGAEPLGVPGTASRSSMADMGGLVAKGDGTAAGNPNVAVEGPRLKPRLGKFAVVGGGGLVAEGVEGVGTVLLLNSAQRGHLRLVSIIK